MEVINGLWIGKSLSPLEQLTIRSFHQNGYAFRLWVYEEVANIPSGTVVANANEIIPASKIFSYSASGSLGVGKGSYAGFSDIFRYKLLLEQGGVWSDMDICCLEQITELKSDYFFRDHRTMGAVGNLMKTPPQSPLMQYCYDRAIAEITETNTDWMLPIYILNAGIKKYQLSRFIDKISNDDSFPEVSGILSGSKRLDRRWKLIHLMNEEFRRLGLPTDAFLANSQLGLLMEKYKVPFRAIEGKEIDTYLRKLSRLRYIWLTVKAHLSER